MIGDIMNDNFYTSKKWRKLVKALRTERAVNGIVYCEHCGKPIEREYEIIAHHVTELNASNIDNADVTLNPNNIKLVHHRCHNIIHGKTGYVKPVVYIVYGAPCSGKNTYVNNLLHEGDLLVDIDRIWYCLSGMPMYKKPPRINANVFGVYNHLLEDIKRRNGKWKVCYIVGGFKNKLERERLADRLGARLVFVDTPKEECLYRLEQYADGRNKSEWKKFIEDWFLFNPTTPPA